MRKPCLCTQTHLFTLLQLFHLLCNISYTGSVNCIGFLVVCCTTSKSLAVLIRKVIKTQSLKSCQILYAHKHCFLMLGQSDIDRAIAIAM